MEVVDAVATSWDEEFHPSTGVRSVMRWAHEHGATTLGEAFDLLEQLEISADVPEVLGEEDTVDDMREELGAGLELVGPDVLLTDLS